MLALCLIFKIMTQLGGARCREAARQAADLVLLERLVHAGLHGRVQFDARTGIFRALGDAFRIRFAYFKPLSPTFVQSLALPT